MPRMVPLGQSPPETALDSESPSVLTDTPLASQGDSACGPERIAPSEGRRCTVVVDDKFSPHDVQLNMDLLIDFPGLIPGSLMSISVLPDPVNQTVGVPTSSRDSLAAGHGQTYVFTARDMSKAAKTRCPSAQVLVIKRVASAFGLKKGSLVMLRHIDNTNPAVEASHIEMCFKDQHLSRSDMWRMTVAQLTQRTVYKGQPVLFMGTIKAQVTAVYVNGDKTHSAFFVNHTKIIFRTESARYVLLIQMAREMWEFDPEGSGEIMFNKVVEGFLPALFKKWALLRARHIVSIVLFARVEYNTGLSAQLAAATLPDYYTGGQSSGGQRPYKDFYRVVVSEMTSLEWTAILFQLKRELNFFRRDISLFHHQPSSGFMVSGHGHDDQDLSPTRVKAESSLAMYGNVLEAINLASSQFANDYVDRDLRRTGISIVLVSPGPGVFQVESDLLKKTSDALVASGIGIDLVCLSKLPLHCAPLFRYKNPIRPEPVLAKSGVSRESITSQPTWVVSGGQSLSGSLSPTKGSHLARKADSPLPVEKDEWCFAVPQWLHLTYWTGMPEEESSSLMGIAMSAPGNSVTEPEGNFDVRCRMYDLQMRSVLETNEIETAPMHQDPLFPRATVDAHAEGRSRAPRSRAPGGLTEWVYGMHKFPDWVSKLPDKSLWKQLSVYDDSRARLPQFSAALTQLRPAKEPNDESRKYLSESPTGLFGTSFSDRRAVRLSFGLNLSASPNDRDGRSDNVAVGKHLLSKLLPAPPGPKSVRNISLTNRGFGVAAPKVVAAEVNVETVAAAVATSVAASKLPLRWGASTPLATPPAKLIRPASSQSSSSVVTISSASRNIWPGSLRSTGRGTTTTGPGIPVNSVVKGPASNSLVVSSPIGSTSGTMSPIARISRHSEAVDGKNYGAVMVDDVQKVFNLKLRAGSARDLPPTLSPEAAMAPWLTILNPCIPDARQTSNMMLYSRWRHISPQGSDVRIMRWKNLCCPSAVPLTTEYFPSRQLFDSEYQRNPYNIDQSDNDESPDQQRSREDMIRELISLRLSHGFQIVLGPAVARAFNQKLVKNADLFSRHQVLEDGMSVFMSRGNTIHQLSCVNGTEVEVNIFARKIVDPSFALDRPIALYRPAIRTLMEDTYRTEEIELIPERPDRNWNMIDTYLAGHDVRTNCRFWSARFVLIPMTPSQATLPKIPGVDSPEEIRIEGINRLTLAWRRHRYMAPHEQRPLDLKWRKISAQSPLDIIYKTADASTVIAAEFGMIPLLDRGNKSGQPPASYRHFTKANINRAALAEAMQQPPENGGVGLQHRPWHFWLHLNCFIGSDMTTWLLRNFDDLETREEAEQLGNVLMVDDQAKAKEAAQEVTKDKDDGKEGKKDDGAKYGPLFVHVAHRHLFRDGNYFYQIAPEFSKTKSAKAAIFKKRGVSVPPTPIPDILSKSSPRSCPLRPSAPVEEAPYSMSGTTTPTGPNFPIAGATDGKAEVVLSKSIKYDIDHRKRSHRPELVDLHYDQLHNPDTCFHIQIDWLNVTVKLIEDAVEGWAREALAHGLLLVELPIKEALALSNSNALRRPFVVRLALRPPERHPTAYWDSYGTPNHPPSSVRYYYQHAILRRLDFVLDYEAASNFPANVDVSYSWGRPSYRHSQYVHRSGRVLAQINDDGHFLLMLNYLFHNRLTPPRHKELRQPDASRSSAGDHKPHGPPAWLTANTTMAAAAAAATAGLLALPRNYYTGFGAFDSRPSPTASPRIFPGGGSSAIRPTAVPTEHAASAPTQKPWVPLSCPYTIRDEFVAFCSDAAALKALYTVLFDNETAAAASPSTASVSDGTDANIPALGLPPAVLDRAAPLDVGH